MAEQRKGKRTPQQGGHPGLTGGGPSIVGVSGAMRARDVSRIKPEHEAHAQRRVVVKRRPPDPPEPRSE